MFENEPAYYDTVFSDQERVEAVAYRKREGYMWISSSRVPDTMRPGEFLPGVLRLKFIFLRRRK